MRLSYQKQLSISPKVILSLDYFENPFTGNNFESVIEKKDSDIEVEAGGTIAQFNTFTIVDGLAYESTNLETDGLYPESRSGVRSGADPGRANLRRA